MARGLKEHARFPAAKLTMRDKAGVRYPVELDGFAVTFALLPGWNFHARLETDGSWIFSEIRTGAKFPPVRDADSLNEAVLLVEAFIERQGREECERVFQTVLDKFGDLTRPQ